MESGFPLDIPIDELCVARESAQIEHVHMNAFDGKFWGWTFPEGEGTEVACVASVSVRFRRKERGTRVKDREKSGASKRAGRGSSFPSPSPLFHFLALVSFLARSKPKVSFLGISLPQNQTETLATQASTEGMFGYGGAAWTLEPLVCSKGTFPKTKMGLSWTIALVIGQHNYS